MTAPVNTSKLKISSPIYAHTVVTALAPTVTTGSAAENTENMIHASTMIAPSRQTAAYDFRNDLPICEDGSPAKVDNGTGTIAV